MAYGSASGGLVRRMPFLKKCSIDLGVKFLLSIHCRKTAAAEEPMPIVNEATLIKQAAEVSTGDAQKLAAW
jgi:hypothetical protein